MFGKYFDKKNSTKYNFDQKKLHQKCRQKKFGKNISTNQNFDK